MDVFFLFVCFPTGPEEDNMNEICKIFLRVMEYKVLAYHPLLCAS